MLAALDEPFRLEPLQHLAGRRARDAEHLGDPRRERRQVGLVRPVLADREREEVDRLQVFVDRVTLRHRTGIVSRRRCPRRPRGHRRRGVRSHRGRVGLRCSRGRVLPRGPRLRRPARRRRVAVPRDRARAPLRCGSSSARSRGARSSARRTRASRSASRHVFGAYVVGVGINSVAPARGGDVVKLYLIKHRIPDAQLRDARADARRRDGLRLLRRRRADHLGARDRRAADARGLLAAAVGRLGLPDRPPHDGARSSS